MHIPDWLHYAIQTYGYWMVFLAIGVESTGVPFPGETTLLVAATYAGTTHKLNFALVILAAAAGAIIGDNLGYLIGRYGGYRVLGRVARFFHLNQSHLDYAQRFFAKHGNKTVFLGRFFALLRTWAAFLAGVHQMSWRSFLFWNAAGGIAWAALYGTLGYVLGNNLPLLQRIVHGIGIGGTVVTVVAILAALVYWRVRRRKRLLAHLQTQQVLRATGPRPAPQPLPPITRRTRARLRRYAETRR